MLYLLCVCASMQVSIALKFYVYVLVYDHFIDVVFTPHVNIQS